MFIEVNDYWSKKVLLLNIMDLCHVCPDTSNTHRTNIRLRDGKCMEVYEPYDKVKEKIINALEVMK